MKMEESGPDMASQENMFVLLKKRAMSCKLTQ